MSTLAPRTPRDFRDLGFELVCYCEREPSACRHSGTVTMATIAARLGWAFDLYAGRDELGSRLVCSVCGRRHPTTIISRVTTSVPTLGHPPPAQHAVPIEEATRRWLALAAEARMRDAATGYDQRPAGRRRSRRRARCTRARR